MSGKTLLNADEYDGKNGITIYCKSCGFEMNETADDYYYSPAKYEEDLFDRLCSRCREF